MRTKLVKQAIYSRGTCSVLASFLSTLIVCQPILATCGGGGLGGASGGSGGAAGQEQVVYKVDWKMLGADFALPRLAEEALLVLWFPPASKAFKKSKLHTNPEDWLLEDPVA
jgi:hypothetical protein